MAKKRKEEILQLLKQRRKMSVKDLAEKCYVCEMTIRRDLKELEESGYVKRYQGGAILVVNETELPLSKRKLIHSEEKIRLAKEAASYVEDGNVIFIDSSSTCMYIIPQLTQKKEIHILTNSISALILAVKHHIPCTMIGGNCFEKDLCTVGAIAIQTLEQINVDIAFFSSLAISDDGIISDSDEAQTAVRKTVIRNAIKSVFIFTQSKQHKKSTYTLCNREQAFRIIL